MRSLSRGQIVLIAALIALLILTGIWVTTVWNATGDVARLDRARARNLLLATDRMRIDGADVLQ
jgi:hypothetical protein